MVGAARGAPRARWASDVSFEGPTLFNHRYTQQQTSEHPAETVEIHHGRSWRHASPSMPSLRIFGLPRLPLTFLPKLLGPNGLEPGPLSQQCVDLTFLGRVRLAMSQGTAPFFPSAPVRSLFRYTSIGRCITSQLGLFRGTKQTVSDSPYLGVIFLALDAGRSFVAQRGRRGSPGGCAGDHGKVFLQHAG